MRWGFPHLMLHISSMKPLYRRLSESAQLCRLWAVQRDLWETGMVDISIDHVIFMSAFAVKSSFLRHQNQERMLEITRLDKPTSVSQHQCARDLVRAPAAIPINENFHEQQAHGHETCCIWLRNATQGKRRPQFGHSRWPLDTPDRLCRLEKSQFRRATMQHGAAHY